MSLRLLRQQSKALFWILKQNKEKELEYFFSLAIVCPHGPHPVNLHVYGEHSRIMTFTKCVPVPYDSWDVAPTWLFSHQPGKL